MVRWTVEADRKQIRTAEQRLGGLQKHTPNVMARAANRAATTINSEVSKELRKVYIIKAGTIKETMRRTKANKSNMSAEVISKGPLLGLDKFKFLPRQPKPTRKAPIKVGVKKGSLRQVTGAFVADVNGVKVFTRDTRKRLPIRRLFGPSVPQMIENEKVQPVVEEKALDTFNKRVDHEIGRILERGR